MALEAAAAAAGAPLFVGSVSLQRAGHSMTLTAFGVDPTQPDFLGPELRPKSALLALPDSGVIDRLTRWLAPDAAAAIRPDSPATFEIRGRTLTIYDGFDGGGGFGVDGYLVVSDQTFLKMVQERQSAAPDHVLLAYREAAPSKRLDPFRLLEAGDAAPPGMNAAGVRDATIEGEVDGSFTDVREALGLLRRLHARRNRVPAHETLHALLTRTRAHAALALRPGGEQAIAMAVANVAPGEQADDMRAAGHRACDPDWRILDDQGVADVDPELVGGVEIDVGMGLEARHMLARAIDVRIEPRAQAEVVEMAGQPATDRGRRHRDREVGRQGLDEAAGAGNLGHARPALAQPRRKL